MNGNFPRALARVLVYEGGVSDNPKDPGGLTNKGVTQRTYNNWRSRKGLVSGSVRDMTDTEMQAIYREDYWDRVQGDQLPPGVDFCIFDAAVNSGVGSAATWAQGVVGLPPDGDLGPKTLTAIQAQDDVAFIQDYCARRLGTLERNPNWSEFGNGWHARIANVEKIADQWADGGEGPDPVQVSTIGGHTKAGINDVKSTRASQIAAHATTIGGAVGTAAAQTGQTLAPASDTFAWMKYILGGLTIFGAIAAAIVMVAKNAGVDATNGTLKATVNPNADAEVPSVKVPLIVASAA